MLLYAYLVLLRIKFAIPVLLIALKLVETITIRGVWIKSLIYVSVVIVS